MNAKKERICAPFSGQGTLLPMEEAGKAALLLIRLGLDVQQRIASGVDGVPQPALVQCIFGENDAGSLAVGRSHLFQKKSLIIFIISVKLVLKFLLIG